MDNEKKIEKIKLSLTKAIMELYEDTGVPMDEHLNDTPKRIAKMWVNEMTKGFNKPDFEFTTFPSYNSNIWIVKKDIEFSSFCAHHFLPFYGKVSIGYVPRDKICGLSKLDRVVNYLSKKPQVQENFGHEILAYLNTKLYPNKIAIQIEAVHTCVTCRGAESSNSSMITANYFDIKDYMEFKEMLR